MELGKVFQYRSHYLKLLVKALALRPKIKDLKKCSQISSLQMNSRICQKHSQSILNHAPLISFQLWSLCVYFLFVFILFYMLCVHPQTSFFFLSSNISLFIPINYPLLNIFTEYHFMFHITSL